MIELKDLRIGNYYLHSQSGIIQLNGEWISYFAKFPELLSGIPLTEYILMKSGFKRQNNALNGPHKNDFSLWNPKGDDEFTLNDTLFIPQIKYLHQLQNLYYALTGTEISINLNQ